MDVVISLGHHLERITALLHLQALYCYPFWPRDILVWYFLEKVAVLFQSPKEVLVWHSVSYRVALPVLAVSVCNKSNKTTAQWPTQEAIRDGYKLMCLIDSTKPCGNYSDTLPLKAARRDSIFNLTFLGFESDADKPKAVSFKVAVGRHVNAA